MKKYLLLPVLLLCFSLFVTSVNAANTSNKPKDSATKNTPPIDIKLPDLQPEEMVPGPNNGFYSINIYNRGTGVLHQEPGKYIHGQLIWRYANGIEFTRTDFSLGDPPDIAAGDKRAFLIHPNSFPKGAGQVTMKVDSNNRFTESNESNNEKVFNLPLPDLKPEGMVPTGDGLEFTFYNRGDIPVYSIFSVIRMSEVFTTTQGTDLPIKNELVSLPPNLKPGDKFTYVMRTKDIPFGAKKVKISIDSEIQITEKDRYNNWANYDLNFPDLTPEEFVPVSGGYDVHIYNRGTGSAVVSGNNWLEVLKTWDMGNGVLKNFNSTVTNIGEIKPGSMYNFNLPADTFPAGAREIIIEVNKFGKIRESSADNNKIRYSLPVSDLVIDSLTRADDTGEVSVNIRNNGPEWVYLIQNSDHVKIHFKLLDKNRHEVGSTDWDTNTLMLTPGQTLTQKAKLEIPNSANGMYLLASVDSTNVVHETNEDNNSFEYLYQIPDVKKAALDGFNQVTLDLKEATPGARIPIISGLANINAVPCEPLYAVKNIGRGLESFLTFGDENKAKLSISNANEKAGEAATLINSSKKDKSGCASDALADATKDISKANVLIDKLGGKSPSTVQPLIDAALLEQFNQQKVVGKLVKEASSSAEALAKAKGIQENSLDTMTKTLEKSQDKSIIKKLVVQSSEKSPDPLTPVTDLQVLVAIKDKLSLDKKDLVKEAVDDSAIKVKQIVVSLPDDKKQVFKEYVDTVDGTEVNKLKALDEVRRTALTGTSKAVVLDTKENLIKEMGDQLTKNQNTATTLLSDLEGGSIDDLRVLEELDGIGGSSQQTIDQLKKEATSKFITSYNSLDKDKKDMVTSKMAEDYSDITQLSVYKSIQNTTEGEELNELNQELTTEIKDRLNDKNAYEKQKFMTAFSDRSSDEMEEMKQYASLFDKDDYAELIQSQLKLLKTEISDDYDQSEYADLFDDAEYQKFLDQYGNSLADLADYFENYDWEEDESVDNDESEETNYADGSEESYDEVETTSGCPSIDDPVCGKDGYSYSNECEARAEDVEVAYKGECREEENDSSDEDEVLGISTSRFQLPNWFPFK